MCRAGIAYGVDIPQGGQESRTESETVHEGQRLSEHRRRGPRNLVEQAGSRRPAMITTRSPAGFTRVLDCA